MRNAVLHLITNKAGEFGIPTFPSDSNFVPFTASAEETKLRAALRINDGPYFLINSLIAVYTFSDILAEFRETETTFDLHNIPQINLNIYNATYANTATENFNIANVPDTFPSTTYFTWTIKYNDEDTLILVCCDKKFTIPYTLTDTTINGNPARVLTAEWPAVAGIKGGFHLNDDIDWSGSAAIYLYVPPITFPYEAAVAKVAGLAETTALLTNAGLSRNFHNAQSAIEKYALLMLALAQTDARNPAVSVTC